MSETAACTVKGYNALRSAAVRSASMSMVHATTNYVRVLARRRDTRDGLLHRRGRLAPKKDPGMMQLVGQYQFHA